MIRAFVAIDISPKARAALEKLQRRLPFGRVADAETFHVTMAFMGDLGDDALEAADDVLSSVTARPFELRIGGVGVFDEGSPRVLFAGVAETPDLTALAATVQGRLSRAGFRLPRRRFRPHVTLARSNAELGTDGAARLAAALAVEVRFALPPEPVSAFSLFRSDLSAKGARHREMARYPLTGGRTA